MRTQFCLRARPLWRGVGDAVRAYRNKRCASTWATRRRASGKGAGTPWTAPRVCWSLRQLVRLVQPSPVQLVQLAQAPMRTTPMLPPSSTKICTSSTNCDLDKCCGRFRHVHVRRSTAAALIHRQGQRRVRPDLLSTTTLGPFAYQVPVVGPVRIGIRAFGIAPPS